MHYTIHNQLKFNKHLKQMACHADWSTYGTKRINNLIINIMIFDVLSWLYVNLYLKKKNQSIVKDWIFFFVEVKNFL